MQSTIGVILSIIFHAEAYIYISTLLIGSFQKYSMKKKKLQLENLICLQRKRCDSYTGEYLESHTHSAVEWQVVVMRGLEQSVRGAASDRSRGAVTVDRFQAHGPLHLPRGRVGSRWARLKIALQTFSLHSANYAVLLICTAPEPSLWCAFTVMPYCVSFNTKRPAHYVGVLWNEAYLLFKLFSPRACHSLLNVKSSYFLI